MPTTSLIINIVYFIIGIAGLIAGGELLVRGASRFAKNLGISPVIIGLTVVAFGTSSPEFVVCLTAALQGASDITVGNIVGSNIANIALILGVAALIKPIGIHHSITRVQTPFMIFLTLLVFIIALNHYIGRAEGLIVFLMLPVLIFYSYYSYKNDKIENGENNGSSKKPIIQLVMLTVGLFFLILGARLTVSSGIEFARMFGLSELVIGVTIIAIGTSLPELSTAIFSALKNEHEIIVGNVVGSNIFNLGILGLVALIHPITVNPEALKLDFPVMIVLSILIYPVMKIGSRISRVEGAVLLCFYFGFMYSLL